MTFQLTLDDLAKLLSIILPIGSILYAWFATRQKDVDEKVAALTDDLRSLEGRISGAEQTLRSMPDRADFHNLQIQMVEMNGSMREIVATMDGNQNILSRLEMVVGRHEEHLLDGGKR